jgi:hypothetical protein
MMRKLFRKPLIQRRDPDAFSARPMYQVLGRSQMPASRDLCITHPM